MRGCGVTATHRLVEPEMGVQFPSAPPGREKEVIRKDSKKGGWRRAVGNRPRKPGRGWCPEGSIPSPSARSGPIAQPAEALVPETSQSRFESWSGYQADVVFNGSTGVFQAHGTSSTLVVRSSSLTFRCPVVQGAGRVALNHEIEVRILAGQPVVGELSRRWDVSSTLTLGTKRTIAQKLNGERPPVKRRVVGSIPT